MAERQRRFEQKESGSVVVEAQEDGNKFELDKFYCKFSAGYEEVDALLVLPALWSWGIVQS